MHSLVFKSSIFDNFFHYNIVFNTTIYTGYESLLHCGINKFVTKEICCQAIIKEEVVGLPYASTEGNHLKI